MLFFSDYITKDLNYKEILFFMTVIVGVRANKGKDAVVIASDRQQLGNQPLVDAAINYLQYQSDYPITSVLDYLSKIGWDKLEFKLGRKISVSDDRRSALAHTGVENDASRVINNLLLNPPKFLKDDSFLVKLFFPLLPFFQGLSDDERTAFLEKYKGSFDLKERLIKGYIPEIRRIFDFFAVPQHTIDIPQRSPFYYWDRNYNPAFSEFLFAMRLDDNGKVIPGLFDISLTGVATVCTYSTNGAGGDYASSYLKRKLQIRDKFPIDIGEPKRRISQEDAVKIAIGAVEYANNHSPFCKGLDYVIITPEGIETHFSDETGTFKLDLREIIQQRIKAKRRDLRTLARVLKSIL